MFLENEEIGLRPVKKEDAKKFIKILNNERVNKNLTVGALPLLLEEEEKWIEDARERMKKGEALCLTIVLKNDEKEKIIGECSATRMSEENRSPMVGIFIEEDQWKKGYGKKAMTLLINHLFNRFKEIRRISSGAIEYNRASITLHESLGFKEEGRSRKEIYYRGARYDLINFGLLIEEWKN